MTYRLEELNCRSQRRDFVELPRRYREQIQHFVPPLLGEGLALLDQKRHPFYRHATAKFWLLRDAAGQACGRISACKDNESMAFSGDKQGVFGHFLAPDAEGAAQLLEAARSFLREQGLERMRGPIELSTNYTCGLQIGGFEYQPRIDIPQHPPGQQALIEEQGLTKGKDLLCFQIHRDEADRSRLERGLRLAERRSKAHCRNLDLKRWAAELEALHSLYLRSWSKNYAFTPMTRAEFFHAAKQFKKVYVDGLCQIAEIDGEPIGFILSLPDVNVGIRACNGRLFPLGWIKLLRAIKRTDRFRVMTLGIVPEQRGKGLDSLLITAHFVHTKATRFRDAELSWVLEDNVSMIKPLLAMGGSETIRLRIYEQAL